MLLWKELSGIRTKLRGERGKVTRRFVLRHCVVFFGAIGHVNSENVMSGVPDERSQ